MATLQGSKLRTTGDNAAVDRACARAAHSRRGVRQQVEPGQLGGGGGRLHARGAQRCLQLVTQGMAAGDVLLQGAVRRRRRSRGAQSG